VRAGCAMRKDVPVCGTRVNDSWRRGRPMPVKFHHCKSANKAGNPPVVRVPPHPARGWTGWNAWTFLAAPPLPVPLPHSKQWRRGGHGVLDGGWFSMAGWNFGWWAKDLIEFGRGRLRHMGLETNRGGHNSVGVETNTPPPLELFARLPLQRKRRRNRNSTGFQSFLGTCARDGRTPGIGQAALNWQAAKGVTP